MPHRAFPAASDLHCMRWNVRGRVIRTVVASTRARRSGCCREESVRHDGNALRICGLERRRAGHVFLQTGRRILPA